MQTNEKMFFCRLLALHDIIIICFGHNIKLPSKLSVGGFDVTLALQITDTSTDQWSWCYGSKLLVLLHLRTDMYLYVQVDNCSRFKIQVRIIIR